MKTRLPCPCGAGELWVRYGWYEGRAATRTSPAEPWEVEPEAWETDCGCRLDEVEVAEAVEAKAIQEVRG